MSRSRDNTRITFPSTTPVTSLKAIDAIAPRNRIKTKKKWYFQ